jgi:hypothetical protein
MATLWSLTSLTRDCKKAYSARRARITPTTASGNAVIAMTANGGFAADVFSMGAAAITPFFRSIGLEQAMWTPRQR